MVVKSMSVGTNCTKFLVCHKINMAYQKFWTHCADGHLNVIHRYTIKTRCPKYLILIFGNKKVTFRHHLKGSAAMYS